MSRVGLSFGEYCIALGTGKLRTVTNVPYKNMEMLIIK